MQEPQAIGKANGIVGFIARGFEYESKDILSPCEILCAGMEFPSKQGCVDGCTTNIHQVHFWDGNFEFLGDIMLI